MASEDGTTAAFTIYGGGQTLSSDLLTVDFDWGNIDGWSSPAQADLWIEHAAINGGEPTDISSAIDYPATSIAANTLIPRDGSVFEVAIRAVRATSGGFPLESEQARASMTSAAPDASGGPDYEFVKELTDLEFEWLKDQYTSSPMDGTEGYFSAPALWGCAMAHKATDDTSYLTEGIRIGQNWIDSGTDLDDDGYKDWWDYHAAISGPIYNYDHHEYRAASGVANILIELIRSSYDGGRPGRRAEWANFLKKHVWEKWTDGDSLIYHGIQFGDRSSQAVDYVGRWTIIALGLDQAQSDGLIPATSEYRTWIESTSYNPGKFMTNYLNKYGTGSYNIAYWVGGDFRSETDDDGNPTTDTSHASDLIYSILRGIELGYDVGGRSDDFIPFLQDHLDSVWFPTSAGPKPYANGSGSANGYHLSGHRGMAMAAATEQKYKTRWTDFTRNEKPTWTFWDETGHNRQSALAYGGTLMWVLNGGTF